MSWIFLIGIVQGFNVWNQYLSLKSKQKNIPDIYDETESKLQKTFVVEPILARKKRAWSYQPFTVPYGYSGADIDFGKLQREQNR